MGRRWSKVSGPVGLPPWCVDPEIFSSGRLKVIKSIDADRIHLSISHQDRYPTWDEITEARDQFLPPGKIFVMALPPQEYYVNAHKNCFHLWELSEDEEPKLTWIIKEM